MKLLAALAALSSSPFALLSAAALRQRPWLLRADSAAAVAAEEGEARFLEDSWQQLASELREVQAVASPDLLLQLSGKKPAAVAEVEQQYAKMMADSQAAEGKAMLDPAVEMLKGLYDQQKQRIGELNRHEQESKERYTEHEHDHSARLASLDATMKNSHLSQAVYQREVDEETGFSKYWERTRNRNKKGFHNQLNIIHNLMSKERAMMGDYATAEDSATSLVQTKPLARFFRDSLEVVRSELAVLVGDPMLPPQM